MKAKEIFLVLFLLIISAVAKVTEENVEHEDNVEYFMGRGVQDIEARIRRRPLKFIRHMC